MLPWNLLQIGKVRADRRQHWIVEPAPAEDPVHLRVDFEQCRHPQVHLAKSAFIELRQIPRVDMGFKPWAEAARHVEEAQH